ncbi:MAG: glycine zipper 2TM domain-containing protein [Alphaproteobacteria bacterium]|nr:glycine zipper 2TM domain-containing protein [Alphaproteobacteria bacterium]
MFTPFAKTTTKTATRIATRTAISMIGAVLLTAGLAGIGSPVSAGSFEITFNSGPVYAGHGGYGGDGFRNAGRGHGFGPPPRRHFSDWPTRRHVRLHNRCHECYHDRVGRGHRFLPERFHTAHRGGPGHRTRGRGYGGNYGPALVSTPPRRRPAPVHAAAPVHPGPAPHGGRSCNSFNGGTLLGAALGGLIGSQIGKGSGRLAATAAGTFFGAAIGSSAGC